MGWSFIAAARAHSDGSGTSLNAGSTLNVAAGDLLVAITNWNGTAGATPGVRTGVGENDFAMRATIDHPTEPDLHTAVGYKIDATADGTATVEFTLSATKTYRTLVVLQYRPDAGDTVSLDVAATVATGTGYLFSSNAIDPSGDDNIIVALFGQYTDRSIDPTFNIAGGAATLPFAGDAYEAQSGYRLFTSEQGSMDVDIELNAIADWSIELLSFKAVAGGAAYTLEADPGSFALTGQAAALKTGRLLSADAGAFSLSGQAAGLLAARKLDAAAGVFTLVGQDAILNYVSGILLSGEQVGDEIHLSWVVPGD